MGTGSSRGKRVAPVRDVDVTRAAAGVASPERDSRASKPLRIHTILRTAARSRAPADRSSHSDGHDSESSAEDEDAVDAVLADYEGRGRASAKKPPSKKTFSRSRTYGLCSFSGGDTDEDCGSAAASLSAAQTRGSRGAPRAVNRGSDGGFTHCQTHTRCSEQHDQASSPGLLSRGAFLEAVPTPEKQSPFGSYSPPVSMPVILYDGSEEALMDTIEREFS